MASVLTPYSQWIQTLKYDIMSMFQSYKNVFIHRAKLACLCQELSVFHRTISSKQYPTAPAQPNEANYLRQLITLIAGLRQLFHSLDQQHAMQTLVQAPVGYVKQFLGEFRQNFNSHVAALKLVPQAPCPPNAAQEKTDDFADARELCDRLTAYLQRTQIPPDFQQILCQRLQELRQIIQGYEEEQEKAMQQTAARNRPMTQQEVEKALLKMKRWALEHSDFELQKKIGSGGFADVFLGYQRSTRKIVAVKKLHNEEFTEQAFEMFRREIEIFAALNHFAVLPFVGVCCSPPYYIVTEYMSGGCLFNRLHARDGSHLDPTKRTIIALGTAYAMEYLHAQKMVHRDLKSLNILLDADDYPKVCDFGMSREIATDGNMTGGVGTSQWMAPEVLNSDPYDERSDVYSFGIMLWEILTSDVPFRGLKDVQVAMAVVGNQSRPMIPQDCPPRLGKFIKVCWDQEAKARPPFTTIAKAIESGEVVFPGTNMNAVRAYVTRFAHKAAPEPAAVPAAPAPSGPEDLVKKLATPGAGAALGLIRKQIGDVKFVQQLQAIDRLMPNLMKACETCNSADMAADILAVFTGIAATGKGVTPQHVQRVFQVFFNFGTTQMKEVLTLIPRVLQILRENKLTAQQFVKIAAFLQTSDVVTRIESTIVLKSMIEAGIYDKPESLKNLLPYIISNCNKDAVPDLLQPSLEIVLLLLNVSEIRDSFVTYNGLQAIVSIFTVRKPDAVTELAIHVFGTVVTTILLSEEAIRAVVADMEAIFTALTGDVLARFLAAFTGLLSFKTFYKAISTDTHAAPSFAKAFQNGSPAARLIGLKTIYALLMKATSYKAMVEIAPAVVPLLRDKNEAVVAMAAAVLVSAVPDAPNQEQLFTSDVSGFLLRALGSENTLTAHALRMAGAWSNSLAGAQLLEQVGVIPKALAFLTSGNGLHQRLALMFAAAFSSAYPMSKGAVRSLPIFIQAAKHEELHPYPLIFLSNVVMAPDVAQHATGAFNIFASLLGKQQETVVKGALTVVLRVVSCSEALGVIGDKHVPLLIELFKATEKLLNSPLFVHVLEVISALSGTAAGKAAVTQTNLPAALAAKLENLPKKDPNRPTLMRILARCKSQH